MPAARARRSSPSETTSAAGAELAEKLDDGLVGIGLHGVADQRVEARERLAEDVEMARQRRGRVAIEGRADRSGDVAAAARPRHAARRRGIRNGSRRTCPRNLLDQAVEDERLVLDRLPARAAAAPWPSAASLRAWTAASYGVSSPDFRPQPETTAMRGDRQRRPRMPSCYAHRPSAQLLRANTL